MKKFLHIGMWIIFAMMLTGCTKFEPEADAISVQKSGEVVRVFMDEFVDDSNQPYAVEEIQAMMEQELQTYNAKFGEDHITLEECKLEEGTLSIRIKCKEAKYYQDYSSYYNDDFATEGPDVEFFAGTIAEAADFDFGASFLTVGGETSELADVTADTANQVIVLNEPIEVYTSKDILFVSDNVEIIGNRQAKVKESDTLQRAYIIYKK